MIPSKACLDIIKKFEGCKLKAYQDIGGVWTIGFGYTPGVKKGDVWTQAKANTMLASFVYDLAIEVNKMIRVPVNQNQFDALVSFAYNLGAPKLKGSTLLRLLNKEGTDKVKVADEFLKWTRAGGVVVKGLVNRREAERALFLK